MPSALWSQDAWGEPAEGRPDRRARIGIAPVQPTLGLVRSWRVRRARRRRARLVSERERRSLAQAMRAVCKAAADPRPGVTWSVLLRSRAVPLRSELLEVAAMLERAQDPDWACVATLEDLLRDGARSPLYNPALDPRQVAVILDQARASFQAREDRGSAFTPWP